MKVYTITNWRKKLIYLMMVLIAILALFIIINIYANYNARQTITDDPINELQEDVLTQPLRVQALPVPEESLGIIPS